MYYDVGLTQKIPMLAESYEMSSDEAPTITFRLREGVTWHNGEPFTADDVAYTYTMATNPETGSVFTNFLGSIEGVEAYVDGQAESISGIRVIDDYTVEFKLTQPDAVFLDVAVTMLCILPKHILGDVAPGEMREHELVVSKPIGTGPFKLVNLVEDQYIQFERHDSYFLGRPHIEKINWKIIDRTVAAVGLEKEEIDITPHVPTADMERFIDNPDYKIFWQDSTVFCSLNVNLARDYLVPEVRQAIAYAIDRETLTQEFYFGGKSRKPWVYPYGYSWLLPNPNLNLYPYDPEMAKQLLAEGNWDPDRKLDFIFGGGEPSEDVIFMSQNLEAIGIKVALRSMGSGAAAVKVFYEDRDCMNSAGQWTRDSLIPGSGGPSPFWLLYAGGSSSTLAWGV